MILSTHNGPADVATPPGHGTGGISSHAESTLLAEPFEMSGFAPIDGHPGFYRRGSLVYFRFRDRRRRLRWGSAQTIKEAERKKLERELEVERGDYRDGSRERFADYARR